MFTGKKRRGNMLLVLGFAFAMAMASARYLMVGADLYTTSKDSAKVYEDIIAYRTAAELSVYDFVADLCRVELVRDLDAEWLSIRKNAIFLQASDDLLKEVVSSGVWRKTDISEVVSGLNLSNPAILTNLVGRLNTSNKSFELCVEDTPTLDANNLVETWNDLVKVHPMYVSVHLTVRGEQIVEQFKLDNLYLVVDQSREDVGGLNKHKMVRFSFKEGDGGVSITRGSFAE